MHIERVFIMSELFPEVIFAICHQSLLLSLPGEESSAVALCLVRPGANLIH